LEAGIASKKWGVEESKKWGVEEWSGGGARFQRIAAACADGARHTHCVAFPLVRPTVETRLARLAAAPIRMQAAQPQRGIRAATLSRRVTAHW